MLQLLNENKEKVEGLTAYKEYCIESTLSTGDKVLSFIYPQNISQNIFFERYIRNKTDEYVIKEIEDNYQGNYKKVVCYLNLEELEGKEWERFESVEQTIENCLNFAIVGTGWTIKINGTLTKKRTVRLTNKSALDIIKQARKTYRVEISYDTLLKQINVYEVIGSDKGVYFIDSLNLKNIKSQGNTYDFYTRLVCIGASSKDADGNDTTIKATIENHQYSSKIKTLIWKDERYTNIESLREDGEFKLNEISKPFVAYSLEIIDLAKLNPKYSIFNYKLGDTVTLISKEKNIKEKHRVVTITEYPDETTKNRCEVANSILTFQDIQQEMFNVAETVSNITSDDGTISEKAIRDILSSGTVDKVIIQRLEAVEATIGRLDVTYAKITDLEVINGHIKNLTAEVAKIGQLEAEVAKIGILEADVGYIKDLVNGNLTSDNIHSLILTSSKVTVENGFIKNAMIESLDVSKVNAGTISTNKFIISSENGGIQIVGATQQFRDNKGNVRLQLGQDAQGAFNFILRGEDGTSVLIDHTGIKEKAITSDLIKENMIAENAVGKKQINYSSFAEGFNADTNTSFIKATHIKLNNQNQSLEVAFNEMTTNVNTTVASVDVLYYLSTSLTQLVGGEWKTVAPEWKENHYMWSKTRTILKNGTSVDSDPTCIAGAKGSNGTPGVAGSNGRGIVSIVEEYAISTSKTTSPTTGWRTTPYTWSKGNYIWTRSKITYKNSDGTQTVEYTTAVCDSSWEAVNELGEIVTANTTALNVQQGQISALISNTTITKENGVVVQLKDEYNSTVATVNSMNSIIGTHTSNIDALTGQVTSVESQTNEIRRTLDETVIKVNSMQSQQGQDILVNGNFANGIENWTNNKSYTFESMYEKQWIVSSTNYILKQNIAKMEMDIKYFVSFLFKAATPGATETIEIYAIVKGIDLNGYESAALATFKTKATIATTEEYKEVKGSFAIPSSSYENTFPNYKSFRFQLTVNGSPISGRNVGITDIKLIETTQGNYATVDSVAEIKLKVEQNTAQIALKVGVGEVKSTIEQNPDSIRIGFNKINNFIEITTASGIKVNHTDGSYTRMNGDGIARYVSGTKREYKYITYITEVVLRNDSTMAASMVGSYTGTLPSEYRVKGIKGFIGIGTFYPFDGVNSFGDHPMSNPVSMLSISPLTVFESDWTYRFSYNITGTNAVKSYWQLKLNLMFIA